MVVIQCDFGATPSPLTRIWTQTLDLGLTIDWNDTDWIVDRDLNLDLDLTICSISYLVKIKILKDLQTTKYLNNRKTI